MENLRALFILYLLASDFMGALTKGQGVLGGVYGYQVMDYLNSIIGTVGLWTVLVSSILLYFILEFNLRPSSIKAKLDKINENTIGKVKSMIPDSDDDFEADEELKEEAEEVEETAASRVTVSDVTNSTSNNSINTVREPEPVSIPKGFPEVPVSTDIETITTLTTLLLKRVGKFKSFCKTHCSGFYSGRSI